MRRLFYLLMFAVMILYAATTSAQDVTNDNLINYYVKITRLWQNGAYDDGYDEPFWKIKWRLNQAYSLQCSDSSYPNTGDSNGWCVGYNESEGNHYPDLLLFSEFSKPATDYVAISYISWENDDDFGNDCSDDSDDDGGHCGSPTFTIKSGTPCVTHTNTHEGYEGRSQMDVSIAWRYTKGYDGYTPLTFGAISSGTKTHTNSTKTGPQGHTGYGNGWSYAPDGFRQSNDVTYTFQLTESRRVTIRTDYPETDYDTYVHLMGTNGQNDYTYNYIEGDDDDGAGLGSLIIRDLCPGYYYVVVEGAGASSQGNFKLTIGVSAATTVSPGVISSTETSLCEGAQIPELGSATPASSPCGSVSYQWYKNGNLIPGATGATYDDPGTMGSSTLTYYRRAKDAGNTSANSNTITITKDTPSFTVGSINLSGSTTFTVPAGADPGVFTSSANASATPAPFTIQWEKRELTGSTWSGWSAISGATGQTYDPPALDKTTEFRRTVFSKCGAGASSNAITFTVIQPNGKITGKVSSQQGTGVPDVLVTAKRLNEVQGGAAGVEYTATTDASGNYSIDNIYYGPTQANFKVTPTKTNHTFDPANTDVTINSSSAKVVNFTDVSVFTISGKVTQTYESNVCPAKNVKVELVYDGVVVKSANTDNSGNYSMTVENQGAYVIRPVSEGHQFQPATLPQNIDNNIPNLNFSDITTFDLSGYVMAACETFMGTAIVTVSDKDNCFSKSFATNGQGLYQITNLPAREYEVQVTNLNPVAGFDNLTVLDFFSKTKSADLRQADQALDFIYHRPPVIEVTGFPEPDCDGYDQSILEQTNSYALTIRVWEEGGSCPVGTGKLVITDQIADRGNTPDTLTFTDGYIEYEMTAGNPNIVSPYLKNITFVAIDTFERSDNYNRSALVTGARPREQNFTTQSPQIPLLILRDPPGDGSYSFLEKSVTAETATRFYSQNSNSINTWADVKIGTKFEAGILGISTETSFWGDVKGSYEVNSTNTNANEVLLSMTTTENFETSGNPEITGTEGDVFVGAALAFAYTIADEVLFDRYNCEVALSKSLVMADEGLEVGFIFTENHIRDFVIPDLESKRAQATSQAKKDEYSNQILVWEQTLQRNEELKAAANEVEILQFSANAPKTKSTTETSSESISIDFGMEINEEVASELGFEVGGSGLSGGVITNFRMETGNSKTTTVVNTLTTGYHLEDDDSGDSFTVKVKTDPVYKTPVFELLGGQSSCPVEEGTNAREAVKLRADNPIQAGIPADGEAEFILKAGNISETDETRDYYLRLRQSTNPNGALITINGSDVNSVFLEDIAAGQEQQVTVRIKRAPSSPVYSYEGIVFQLYSSCDDPEVVSTVALSAYFQSPCSSIQLTQPAAGWVLAQADNNQMFIRMKGYDKNNLDQVAVEYAPAGGNSWAPALVLGNNDLSSSASGTEVVWNTANVPDGKYDIRLKLSCGVSTVYTGRVSGIIDRKGPRVFGIPQPADDNLAADDEISVVFNETINCNTLTDAQVMLQRIYYNENIPAQLTCSGDKVLITPLEDLTLMPGERFRVILSEVKDLYGNFIDAPVKWEFNAGNGQAEDDFDGDMVIDALDQCQGYNDTFDADGDGIPDGCDNCPDLANPGLAFDGIDDFVWLGAINGLDGGNQAHTMEVWVYLNDFSADRCWPILLGAPGAGAHHWIINANGVMQIGVYDGPQLNPVIKPGRWTHFATVYDGAKLKLYINGSLYGEIEASFNFTSALQLGYQSNFNGKMDEFRLWNTARTQAEISADMRRELTGSEPGLVVYYNFDQGVSGGDNTQIGAVSDLSSFGNNGSFSGFQLTGETSNFGTGAAIPSEDADHDGIGDACDSEFTPVREVTDLTEPLTIVNLFPNPASESVYVDFSVRDQSALQVQLFDMIGRPVLEKRVDAAPGEYQLQLNVAHLPSGTYLVRLTREDGRYDMRKLIIQD
ncbi:MAG: T9SS type A sorting domain-containing protein [Lewinella sp.]|nr:T9SS type A sorting domain-containing protein [Lewinella sp.]